MLDYTKWELRFLERKAQLRIHELSSFLRLAYRADMYWCFSYFLLLVYPLLFVCDI